MSDEPVPRPPERPAPPERTFDQELLDQQQEVATDPSRVERMRGELEMGFRELRDVRNGIAVFGSARTPPDSPEYALGVEIGRRLGRAGYAVITGGGPGAMEAANRGAREARSLSVGLAIDLPFETDRNGYIDLLVDFHYFFARKVMFVRYSHAFVVLPGGLGTLDELFEASTLIATGKILQFPVVLVGRAFWSPLIDWLRTTVLAGGKVDRADIERFMVVDSAADAVELVQATCPLDEAA